MHFNFTYYIVSDPICQEFHFSQEKTKVEILLTTVVQASIIMCIIEQPYQEWRRDRPDEARQPALYTQVYGKVLIPAVCIER